MKTTMVFKSPNGWVNLLIKTAHPLGNIGMDAVAQLAGAALLGFIGLTAQWAAVLKLPDAEVAQHTFPLFQFEAAGADIARNLQPFRQVLVVIPAIKFVLMHRVDLHHDDQDSATD